MGILKPARINSSGYRIYGQEEVDRLQQILYKEMGVSLEDIKDIITDTSFDAIAAKFESKSWYVPDPGYEGGGLNKYKKYSLADIH